MKLKLTDNLFLKLLSIGLAVILWLAVVNISDAEGTKTFSKEVTLLNTDIITENGQVFRVEDNTNVVKVTVRARKSVLDKLRQEDFILTADMKKDLKYNYLVGINVECRNKSISVAEDVTLDRYNIQVSVEDSATEQFPVIVRYTGKPADGMVVGSLVPEQTVIKITGPVSIVERIRLVEALVDVTGLPGNTVKTCTLNLYDGADDVIDTTYLNFVGKSDGIDITVSLLNTKTVPLKFQYSGTPAENYEVTEISCKPETVDIAGTAEVLSGITRLEIPESAVDVEGIDEELQLVVDITEYLPSGIILEDAENASVLVTVKVTYVEPEEDEESEKTDKDTDKDTGKDTGKDNDKTTDKDSAVKPSGGSEDKKPSDSQTGTDSKNDKNESGNTSDGTQEDKNDTDQSGTESGESGKTEGNS